MKPKSLALKCAFVVAGGLAGWLGLEAAYLYAPGLLPHQLQIVRTMDLDKVGMVQRDAELHHVFKPAYSRRIDWWRFHRVWRTAPFPRSDGSVGYREDAPSSAQPVYAVALGDSYTSGWAVNLPDTWAGVLERLSGARVANLGVDGYGTIQERRLYRRYGRLFKPRLVLVLTNITDPQDDFYFQAWRRGQRIYRANFFWRQFQGVIDPYLPLPLLARVIEFYGWRYIHTSFYPDNPTVDILNRETVRVGMPSVYRELAALGADAARDGAVLVVVLMDRHVARRLIPFLRQRKIRFLDLSRGWESGLSRYQIPLDLHLNEEGHRFIGEAVFRYLSDSRLLPAPAAP